MVLQNEVDKTVGSLKDKNQELRKENKWLVQRMIKLEGNFLHLSQEQEEINNRINAGENLG